MKNVFETGKTYRCISVLGAYPSFREVHDDSNSKIIYMESGYIQIPPKEDDLSDSLCTFSCRSFVIEPVCGENYICKCADPVILIGPVCFPVTEISPCCPELKNQLKDFFPDLSEPLLEIVLDSIYWNFTHVKGLSVKDALIHKLNQSVTPYNGPWHGFSSWEKESLTLAAICLPDDYDLLKGLMKKHVLPKGLHVEFDESKGFYVVAPNGFGLRRWYEEILIAPVELE